MVSPGFPFWFVGANKSGIHKSQMRRARRGKPDERSTAEQRNDETP